MEQPYPTSDPSSLSLIYSVNLDPPFGRLARTMEIVQDQLDDHLNRGKGLSIDRLVKDAMKASVT